MQELIPATLCDGPQLHVHVAWNQMGWVGPLLWICFKLMNTVTVSRLSNFVWAAAHEHSQFINTSHSCNTLLSPPSPIGLHWTPLDSSGLQWTPIGLG